jgi:hypothetical protein
MLTVTTLTESDFSSLGQWLSSFVSKVKSEEDQDKVASLISLFIIECGRARAMIGNDESSYILFSDPDGPIMGRAGDNPESTADSAKEYIVSCLPAIDAAILNMNGVSWSKEGGYQEGQEARMVSIHFNYGYYSLSFVSNIAYSDPMSSTITAVYTDNPSHSIFDGWARWLTPIETSHAS